MIIVKLKGGLGNQMFQIYTGISYALDQKIDYSFSDNFYRSNHPNTTPRGTYWDTIFKNISKNMSNGKIGKEYVNHLQKSYNWYKLPILKNITLNGYFQSHKYFSHNIGKINEILNIPEMQAEIRLKYPYDYKNFCSIHVRLGDYKKYPEHHINLDKNYFLEALKMIFKIRGKKEYLVFYEAEDLGMVKEIIQHIEDQKINNRITFKYIDTQIPDYEQLLIMSCCESHIISNSSFSWWAAYLNNHPKKCVVRPSQWFGPKIKSKITDLCPTSWKIINV